MELTTDQIRIVNDTLRKSLCAQTLNGTRGKLLLTSGVCAYPPDAVARLLKEVSQFDRFTPDNDPHKEHDMGAIHLFGQKFYFKFSYYDSKYEFYGHDIHTLLVMLAEEY